MDCEQRPDGKEEKEKRDGPKTSHAKRFEKL
jgi:hypothetical protein